MGRPRIIPDDVLEAKIEQDGPDFNQTEFAAEKEWKRDSLVKALKRLKDNRPEAYSAAVQSWERGEQTRLAKARRIVEDQTLQMLRFSSGMAVMSIRARFMYFRRQLEPQDGSMPMPLELDEHRQIMQDQAMLMKLTGTDAPERHVLDLAIDSRIQEFGTGPPLIEGDPNEIVQRALE